MSLVSRQIPSLYDGVSQQPANLRLASQCEAQINGWSTVVQGVGKRASTQHVAQLDADNVDSAYIDILNFDTNDRYLVSITDGDLEVFDLAGNSQSVSFPYGKGYLNYGGAAVTTWAATTEWTLVGLYCRPTTANGYIYQAASFSGSSTGTTGATHPDWPTTPGDTITDGTIVWVCFVDFTGGTLTPSSDFNSTTVANYSFIVNKTVYCQMQAAGTDLVSQPTGYVTLKNGVNEPFYGESDYNPTAYEQYAANPSGTLKGVVQSFDYLPWPGNTNNNETPTPGDVYEVQGDDTTSFATYYVIWQNGVWDETVEPGLQNSIDASTMPWALIRGSDGTFTFTPFSWNPRAVGDATTNPSPSFIGSQISDVFFYQDRLGFCSGENVIMSRAGDFGTYFRLTVTQLLSDDVIDIGASDTEITKMAFAVPFSTGMSLFSDQTQFRLMVPIEGSLTPTTVAIDVATRFLSSTTVRPIMLGTNLYFVSEDASYAHVREYFVLLNYLGQFSMDAPDLTAHVPTYIPAGVFLLTGSLVHNCLFAATSAQPSRLYVYQMYWVNAQQKGQSAWHYWDFGTGVTVLAAEALDDYVYVILKRNGTAYIEKVNIALGANVGLTDASGNLYDILLDRRCSVTSTYQSGTDTTLFILPYIYDAGNVTLVATGGSTPGAMLDPTQYTNYSSTEILYPGNVAGTYLAGENYTFTYQFSQQFMLNRQNVAVLGGHLTLHDWRVHYYGTAYFEVTTDPYGLGETTEQTLSYVPVDASSYTGLTIGETALEIGTPTFGEGTFEFGLYGDSKEATVTLTNPTPYPSVFLEAEWEGDYTNRSNVL
jgi:hypothetical protein